MLKLLMEGLLIGAILASLTFCLATLCREVARGIKNNLKDDGRTNR